MSWIPPSRNGFTTTTAPTARRQPSAPARRPRQTLSTSTRWSRSPPRPARGAEDSKLGETLRGAHEHRVKDADGTHDERQADDQEQEQIELAQRLPKAKLEFRHRSRVDAGNGSLDGVGQLIGAGQIGWLDEEARNGLVVEVQEPADRGDVHDDRVVQQHRAGVIEADDRERLAADPELAADRAGMTAGGGEVAGDRGADDDVRLAVIAIVQEPASALIRGKELGAIDVAAKPRMRGEVLALDLDHVQKRLKGWLTTRAEEVRCRPGKQALALDGRRKLPDLGCHDANAGDGAEGLRHGRGQIAEEVKRSVLARTKTPST